MAQRRREAGRRRGRRDRAALAVLLKTSEGVLRAGVTRAELGLRQDTCFIVLGLRPQL